MKKLDKFTIKNVGTNVDTKHRSSIRHSRRLLVGTGFLIMLVTTISTAQVPEANGVKARADDSRLTTDEREQQLLRRLQNQPSSNASGASGTEGLRRMRFEAIKKDEARTNNEEAKQPIVTNKAPSQTEGSTLQNLQGKPEAAVAKRADGGESDQELVGDLDDAPTDGLAHQVAGNQAPANGVVDNELTGDNLTGDDLSGDDLSGDDLSGDDQRENAAYKQPGKDPQPPSKLFEARGVNGKDSNLANGNSRMAQQAASEPVADEIDEAQLPSPKSKRIARVAQQRTDDPTQPTMDLQNTDVIDEDVQAASYESLEESAETAHLSRGGQNNQLKDRRSLNDTPSVKQKQISNIDRDTLPPAKENPAVAKAISEQSTAGQIQQLEALKENLKLQRELATNQGKLTEVSTELEDTKKRLLTAERQVEELSQRLQHVGDRRTFNNQTLSRGGLRSDGDYDQPVNELARDKQVFDVGDPNGNSPRIIGKGIGIDDRMNGSASLRNDSREPKISEMRGAGSNRSLKRIRPVGDSGDRDRYVEDAFDDQPDSGGRVEIPRQIQSDTNTPLVSVTGEDVQLHSGPDRSYPSVMRLRKGERIVVEEQSAEWLQIIAPNGARAWIERDVTNFDAIARGERTAQDTPADYRSRRAPRMSVEDRALELIRRGGSQR